MKTSDLWVVVGAARKSCPYHDRSLPGAWDQRGHVLWLEVEVWRHGRERSAATAADGRREPAFEVAGCRFEPGPGSAEVGHPKKRLELAGLREDVAFAQAEHRCASISLLY